MEKFGGDDIDRMLEAGSYGPSHQQYNAVPPPNPSVYGSSRSMRHDREYRDGDQNRDRHMTNDHRRGRGGGRGRGAGRGDHHSHMGRSPSPSSRYLPRGDDDELRRREREQHDIERDQRTVFACQIHPKCDERDIFEFFSEVGQVSDVQLIRDNRTFKSKGLCYVEFEDKTSVAQALSLSGQSLGGFPVSVQLTQAEKNRAAQQAAQMAQQSHPMKLYVSNIHGKVTEEDIRPVFSAFGEILSLEIQTDHRHKSKGYGFVEFKKEIDAIGAMQQLNELEILGQKIKVTAADQPQSSAAAALMGASAPNGHGHGHAREEYEYGGGGGGMGMGVSVGVGGAAKISEESGNGGLALSTTDKLALMTRLGRGQVKPQHNANTAAAAAAGGHDNHQHGLPPHIQPPQQYSSFNNNVRSRCVLLSNMFNPATETDPDFDMEIREDVREEVAKIGTLLHIYVDKTSQGLVYLKFEALNEAASTINNLNGRWFAKNQIKANYCDENVYDQQFQL